MAIVIGIVIGLGAAFYFTQPGQVQNEDIVKDIKYQKEQINSDKLTYEDEDFVEIINLLDEKSKDKSYNAVKRRFNQISNPDKRK
mmetsp:Transcript_10116/g.9974  ORF Transcript_10116/g.9974 Transcript_10116/m.9974 type:complete len:85 (+) Transcript_10116:19-273(+)